MYYVGVSICHIIREETGGLLRHKMKKIKMSASVDRPAWAWYSMEAYKEKRIPGRILKKYKWCKRLNKI